MRSTGSQWLARRAAFLSILATSAAGCAAAAAVPHGRLGAGEWQVHLPAVHSPFDTLTLSGRAGPQPVHSGGEAVQGTAPKSPPRAALGRALRARSGHDQERGQAAEHEPTAPARRESAWHMPVADQLQTAPLAVSQDSENDTAVRMNPQDTPGEVLSWYAQRQEQTPELQAFRGGFVLIVGTLAVAAVAVVLVLLLVAVFARDRWY